MLRGHLDKFARLENYRVRVLNDETTFFEQSAVLFCIKPGHTHVYIHRLVHDMNKLQTILKERS